MIIEKAIKHGKKQKNEEYNEMEKRKSGNNKCKNLKCNLTVLLFTSNDIFNYLICIRDI